MEQVGGSGKWVAVGGRGKCIVSNLYYRVC